MPGKPGKRIRTRSMDLADGKKASEDVDGKVRKHPARHPHKPYCLAELSDRGSAIETLKLY